MSSEEAIKTGVGALWAMDTFVLIVLLTLILLMGAVLVDQVTAAAEECAAKYGENCTTGTPVIDVRWVFENGK